ncbi:AI-2E family transporter [Agromyces aerolatus]|uniref:AI-2E family transporter n=1 Tax=Agromyces sp. LY-1074 TaxID=3074080 RepID=UPI00285F6B34|nr:MULTISPECIES: AI-2E family transporter [unclassified Agromyces]MDR5700830.1 AI-2E family transporter [Agromyces sp. LY-1074]MDR5707351.1 AI-2E family transporter [Agromyces sp. LY-1358]
MTIDTTRPTWTVVGRPFATGFALTLGGLTAFALGVAFTNLSTVLIWVGFALFAALGLNPVVRRLVRHGISRSWAIVIVCSGLTVTLALLVLLVVPNVVGQVTQFVRDIPHLVTGFQKSDFYVWLTATFGTDVNTIVSDLESFLTHPENIASLGRGALQVGGTIATGLSGLIVVLVLTLYFLASLPAMKSAFLRLLPARARPQSSEMSDEIADSVGGYLIGMVILAFCNAVVSLVLHLVLQLPFAMLLAVVAFFITLIPLVGSVLYWAIATAFALFTDPVAALIFALAYLVYMQIEAYILTPRVMNRTISVPGALVVIGALVGGTLLGLLGALIAIPVTASLLLIGKRIVVPRQDSKT